jgi:hypothetical protein
MNPHTSADDPFNREVYARYLLAQFSTSFEHSKHVLELSHRATQTLVAAFTILAGGSATILSQRPELALPILGTAVAIGGVIAVWTAWIKLRFHKRLQMERLLRSGLHHYFGCLDEAAFARIGGPLLVEQYSTMRPHGGRRLPGTTASIGCILIGVGLTILAASDVWLNALAMVAHLSTFRSAISLAVGVLIGAIPAVMLVRARMAAENAIAAYAKRLAEVRHAQSSLDS